MNIVIHDAKRWTFGYITSIFVCGSLSLFFSFPFLHFPPWFCDFCSHFFSNVCVLVSTARRERPTRSQTRMFAAGLCLACMPGASWSFVQSSF